MVDKRKFLNTEISLLGLGTMRLPCKTPLKREENPLIDYKESQRLVDLAYENGVNYFDTAYMYHVGKSEKFIGSALSKYPRESYMVADKLPIWLCPKPSDMEKVFQKQLKRTGLEYFDNYLLHSLDKKNFEKCEKFGAYDFVLEKKREGKVKNIGFSFHGTIDDLKEIVSTHQWDFAQIQMNYLDWKNQNAEEQYKILTDAGIPIIVMEPVRGGKLADVSPEVNRMLKSEKPNSSIASWAISFVASHENVVSILSGMNSEEQIMDNLNTLTDFKFMTEREFSLCSLAAGMINEKNLIPCTGCDYCADCPKGIKISTVFSIYNQYKNGDISEENAKKLYNSIPKEYSADFCIKCGKCAEHCPQSIKIPDILAGEIKSFFG